MNKPLERRLARLERGTSLGLPWDRPPREWTDEQLLAALGEGSEVTDLVVVYPSTPEALFLGVREQVLAEWVAANPLP